jgi:hypothetical protein
VEAALLADWTSGFGEGTACEGKEKSWSAKRDAEKNIDRPMMRKKQVLVGFKEVRVRFSIGEGLCGNKQFK